MKAVLFKDCRPEVAAGPDGRILAIGPDARSAAGRDAEVVEMAGTALPGLHDAHLHLEWLALRNLTIDLQDVPTRRQALARVRAWAQRLPEGAWVVGRGWYNDAWRDDPSWPRPEELDAAAGGRPAILTRKDGHSAWLSSAAVRAAELRAEDQDPPGTVKETMIEAVRKLVPGPSDEAFDRGMLGALRALAAKGITSAHTMDTPRAFRSFQRLNAAGRLPLRVTWNFPASELAAAEQTIKDQRRRSDQEGKRSAGAQASLTIVVETLQAITAISHGKRVDRRLAKAQKLAARALKRVENSQAPVDR